MSFTASELRRLQLADQIEEGQQRPHRPRSAIEHEAGHVRDLDQRLADKSFGRPRKPPENHASDRRRAQKRAAYYRKKLKQESQR